MGGDIIEAFTDAHVHFWDHDLPRMRWRFLEPDFEHPRLKGTQRLDAPRYTPPEFLAEAASSAPSKVVHVQCAMPTVDTTQETVWLDSLAGITGLPHAIVAGCRLREPGAGGVLAANAAASPLVRGVRDLTITGDVEPEEVRGAFDAADALGTSVEIMVPMDHYGSIGRLAEAWPGVTIVLGHAGQPAERDGEYLDRWSGALSALAEHAPNVVVKLSAIASSLDPGWTVGSIRPWVVAAVEAFGAERSMLASNWPIDRLYGTYQRLIAAYREIVAVLPAAQRAAVLHATADRVYGI